MLILSKLTHELFYILNAGVHSQENVKISFDFVKTHCLKPRYIRCPFPPVQMGSIFWWPSSISAPNLLSTVVGTWVCTNGGVLGVPWSTRYLNRSRLVIDQPCRLRARQLLLLKAGGDSGRTIIGANLECNRQWRRFLYLQFLIQRLFSAAATWQVLWSTEIVHRLGGVLSFLCCDIRIVPPQNLRNSQIPAVGIWSYFGSITRIWYQWQPFVVTIIWSTIIA